MKNIFFISIPSIIVIIIVFLVFQVFIAPRIAKGALQVTASPQSKVYLDDKYIGTTPLCKCDSGDMLNTKEYTLRLEPVEGNFPKFENKVTIAKSVLTVVDRKFGPGASSDGSMISLTPLKEKDSAELLVTSFPEGSDVFLDNNAVGVTPLLLKNVSEADHTLKLKKNGYKEKLVRIRTPLGYKLLANVYLGTSSTTATPEAEVTPTLVLTSPTASPTAMVKEEKVEILSTPNGFLRVRASNSTTAAEVARVNTGEEYIVLDEDNGWYQIELETGEKGWISGQYAEKVE